MAEKGRWTKPAGEHGVDPRDIDEERRDPQRARLEAENRPVVNDQNPTGQQGVSSDKPGIDPGGYPGKRRLAEADDERNR